MKRYSVDEERWHFNQVAASYEAHYAMNQPAALRKVRRLAEEYADYLLVGAPGALIEIGAGTGFFTRSIAPLLGNRPLTATDLSEGMLEVAGKSLPAEITNVRFQREDCLRLSFESGSVAGVVGHGILHHLPLEPVIAELARVLKPGGRLAFYEPNILNPYVFLIKKVPFLRPPGDTAEETALNPFSVRRLLRRYGFEPISITPCEFVLNGTPPALVPCCEMVSRALGKTPGLRLLGGSLRIMAEKSRN